MAEYLGPVGYSGGKVLLGFKAMQIKENMRFERYLVTSAVGKDCFFV